MSDFGPEFHCAGRCFMYLLWLESRIKDFLCIRDAERRNDEVILREYNEMRLTGRPSITYEKQVFKWARRTLGHAIKEFLGEWPEYERDRNVSHAFKIVEIHRNAFAHAYMGSGDRLVFVPSKKTRDLIRDTGLPIDDLGNPDFALLLPCLHEPFIVSFYECIKTIDFACFKKVAKQLEVESYAGTFDDPNWPLTEGINPVTLGVVGTPARRERP